ncbi:hypothetical protein KKF55_01830 [Patescibacteria group bacterium]|nr:hypothetical protein [Patescibacteria group bacterium]
MTDDPKDITNQMILKAIQSVKYDVRGLDKRMQSVEQGVLGLNKRMQSMEQQMTEMEVQLEEKIVEESDRIAMAMIPTNKQLESEIITIKQHVGLAA